MWKREPFYGGCEYYNGKFSVVGRYSPSDPLEFESDCECWEVEGVDAVFASAQEAMDYCDRI